MLINILWAEAQPFSTIDLKGLKPEEYKRKVFRSEKTTTDELNKFSLFLQNTYSYYNFLFNANTQMKMLLENAKKIYKDDYSKQLSFYSYDVDALAKNKYLDTVVEKATTGILMHDLRSKWVDELYFVLGNAYFFQQKYDSAQAVYQYINFAFSPRDDGYFVPIGSNVSAAGDVFSMVTKENNKSFIQRLRAKPKRNDAFLWQIRNMIDSGDVMQANSFIQMLRNDAYFPQRLQPFFDELQAYYFYRLKRWDSSALYLSKTLELEPGNALQARKYFLIGQLYQKTDSLHLAAKYFTLALDKTINPELEIYAALNKIEIQSHFEETTFPQNISQLQSLADREKFYTYRDLIYYNIANSYLKKGELKKAKEAAAKSIQYNINNPQQRNKSFALLANVDYLNKNFKEAAAKFDSITIINNLDKKDSVWLADLKKPMTTISHEYDIINRNDSILRIASMPEKERMAFLEKEAKRIRRIVARQENKTAVFNMGNTTATETAVTDIFASGTASGEWYFNDQNAVQAGFAEFVRRYGNRKNEDNWIRSARQKTSNLLSDNTDTLSTQKQSLKIDSAYVTAQELLATFPSTDAQKKIFRDSINNALFEIGKHFQNSIMDFDAAISYYRNFIYQASASPYVPEVLYNLYLSSYLNKDYNLADSAKNALLLNYGNSEWAKLVNRQNAIVISSSSIQNDTTKVYNLIYQQFLEGKYDEAIAAKEMADKIYGTNYWTPQLLYIEALYYVTKQQDSTALKSLNFIKQRFPQSPMTDKATVLINVLNRRGEIEKYLSGLTINPYRPEKQPKIAKTNFKPKETIKKEDFWKELPKEVIVVLDKEGNPVPKFPETLEEKIKKSAAVFQGKEQNNEAQQKEPEKENAANIISSQKKVLQDSAQVVSTNKNPFEQPVNTLKKPEENRQFNYEKSVATYTMVVLDNVDEVYLNEVGNAFNRYNLIMFDGINIEVQSKNVGDRYTLVLLGPFKNFGEATGYIGEIGSATQTTIIPWLDNKKYLIRTINKVDLDKIKSTEDLEKYILEQH